MKEIVEQILKEEEQAHQRVEKARQDAEQLLQLTRRQAEQILDEALTEAQSVAAQQRQQAEEEVFARKKAVLAEARQQADEALQRKQGAIDGLAGSIHKVAAQLAGGGPSTGWELWCFEDAGGELHPLDTLRQHYRRLSLTPLELSVEEDLD